MGTASPSIARDRPPLLDDVGTVADCAGLTVKEFGVGPHRCTEFTFNAVSITIGNTTGASFGSQKLYDFPLGYLTIKNAFCYFTRIAASNGTGAFAAAGSGDYSLGTTATADATLNSTDADIMASTAMVDPFVASVGTTAAVTAVTTAVNLDGTGTAKDMYLNVIADDADVSDAETQVLTFTGKLWVFWSNVGVIPT